MKLIKSFLMKVKLFLMKLVIKLSLKSLNTPQLEEIYTLCVKHLKLEQDEEISENDMKMLEEEARKLYQEGWSLEELIECLKDKQEYTEICKHTALRKPDIEHIIEALEVKIRWNKFTEDLKKKADLMDDNTCKKYLMDMHTILVNVLSGTKSTEDCITELMTFEGATSVIQKLLNKEKAKNDDLAWDRHCFEEENKSLKETIEKIVKGEITVLTKEEKDKMGTDIAEAEEAYKELIGMFAAEESLSGICYNGKCDAYYEAYEIPIKKAREWMEKGLRMDIAIPTADEIRADMEIEKANCHDMAVLTERYR